MSICKCKCDKIFDSDDELNSDAEGNCCCDNCFETELSDFEHNLIMELRSYFGIKDDEFVDRMINRIDTQSIAENLMDKGYRKVKK